MVSELQSLRNPALWLFLNRVLVFAAVLIGWTVVTIFAALSGKLHSPPSLLFILTWLSGAGYVLTVGRRWHNMLGIIANALLILGLSTAVWQEWLRRPTLGLLAIVPVVLVLFGIPLLVLIRGGVPPRGRLKA